ncbi:MAG TPA: bifunctional riboflavin kinase/FAD synthetase [Solirubrobacteraceae bacterium]|jgi:riboflavin kinase/FMN adenylyltransferase|nr:bifunctional riboflavin kinase/FAD synthetase [Solirubrobacteraceae bacterium]
MRVIDLSDVEPRPRRVAVGEFDGVHLGHREVIRGSDTVLTFEPHPLRVVRPEAAPKLINSLELKAELIAELGVQELVVVRFDQTVAHEPPEQFVDEVLVGRLQATDVSVGDNFRFGHGAAGDAALLAGDARFHTRVMPLVDLDGEIVSSSHIRGLLQAGDVAAAARFLGGPFKLRGEVVHGDERGRELGFPTANIVPDEELVCPGHGIYAARVDGGPAAVSIGVRPTFGTGRAVLVEAYLLDRDEDLYGRTLTVDFFERLRGEQKFDSVERLVAQMHADVARTRALCS